MNGSWESEEEEDYEPEYEPEVVVVGTSSEEIMIPLEVLSLVPPPLEYMSNLHSNHVEISGRQVWCGSLLLAHTLCHMQEENSTGDLFSNKRVLELGSGTGVLGMVISKIGNPSCMLLTDGDDKAVGLLEKNIQNPRNKINSDIVKVHPLLWGKGQDKQQQSDSEKSLISFCKKSWPLLLSSKKEGKEEVATETLTSYHHQFDYLIAGDVLYKKELPELFFQTVNSLLKNKTGVLFLCHVPRSTVTHEIVVEEAQSQQLIIETIPSTDSIINSMKGKCPLDDIQRAKIYRICKAKAANQIN